MMFPYIPFGNQYYFNPGFSPILNDPPTLYAIMNSIANFENLETVKIKDLASASRTQIFDFQYPLSANITKEEFECMILNKFMMRRIGFETMTIFKLQLQVKLNEIMPKYNILFDSINGWNLFSDGEVINRKTNIDNVSNGTSEVKNINNTVDENSYSDTPNSLIVDVQQNKYVSEYTYNKNDSNSTNNAKTNTTDKNNTVEEIKRSNANRVEEYTKFMSEVNSVYTLIFKELDDLFLQIL